MTAMGVPRGRAGAERRTETAGEGTGDHAGGHETQEGDVVLVLGEERLEVGVEGEEDHRVGDVSQQRDGGALVEALDTELLDH